MQNPQPIRSALLSAWRKSALDPLTPVLEKLNVACMSTGGTADYLRGRGLEVREVADLTGFPEIMDGRVKTLHPAVFGGILADRSRSNHLAQLEAHGLRAIDLVAVDLYPFAQGLADSRPPAQMTELIDIGGVALLRAAAKNHAYVGVLSSPEDIARASEWLSDQEGILTDDQRRELAAHTFRLVSEYDSLIADYLAQPTRTAPAPALRYGENPHQAARFTGAWPSEIEPLAGKPLSFNNLLDLDAGLRLIRNFGESCSGSEKDSDSGSESVCVFAVLKHSVPCGLAVRKTAVEAWQAALDCDPISAFGGVVVCNCEIDVETARSIDALFYEVVAAPSFSDEALNLLKAKEKRILIRYGNLDNVLASELARTILTGSLIQQEDRQFTKPENWKVVTKKQPTPEQQSDLILSEQAVLALKSNAIALVKDGQMIGAGTGQTSRVAAMRQAIEKAREMGFDPAGSVLASDGFFPFADVVEAAAAAGIAVLLQPGGSMRDEESTTAADELGLVMIHTGIRHFRH